MQVSDRTRSSQPRRRLLVVDDNVNTAVALSNYLRAVGHQVRTAHDAPDALRVVDSFLPEVALLDIGLPGIDGCELAERLRRRPRLASLRLIAITGYTHRRVRERTAMAGFSAFLVKPVDPAAVAALIDGAG